MPQVPPYLAHSSLAPTRVTQPGFSFSNREPLCLKMKVTRKGVVPSILVEVLPNIHLHHDWWPGAVTTWFFYLSRFVVGALDLVFRLRVVPLFLPKKAIFFFCFRRPAPPTLPSRAAPRWLGFMLAPVEHPNKRLLDGYSVSFFPQKLRVSWGRGNVYQYPRVLSDILLVFPLKYSFSFRRLLGRLPFHVFG